MAKKGKGGGGKKGGGGAKAKSGWQPKPVPEEPLMIRKPVGEMLTLAVRGVIWKMMDFTERVPATMNVFELQNKIVSRHGGGVVDFTLYKESKHPRNLLADPSAQLGDLEFSNGAVDAERVVYYDFEPRVDDCPLLLRAPHDMRIEAMHRAEEAEKREKAERFAARRQGSSGAPTTPSSTIE